MHRRHLISLTSSLILVSASAATAASPPAVPEGAYGQGAEEGGDARVEARLLFDAARAVPGATVDVGVLLSIDSQWHTYWRNSGDAGLATEVTWGARGATFGPMQWAAPTVYELGPVTTYGYSTEVLHAATMTIPKGAKEHLEVRAEVDFLTCKIDCIPGNIKLRRVLPLGDANEEPTADALSRFEAMRRQLPKTPKQLGMSQTVTVSSSPLRPGDDVEAVLDLRFCPGDSCPRRQLDAPLKTTHGFIPDLAPRVTWATTSVTAHPDYPGLRVRVAGRVSQDDPVAATHLRGVLKLQDASGQKIPVAIEHAIPMAKRAADVHTFALPGATNSRRDSASQSETTWPGVPGQEVSLWLALLLAFTGGMLLNVMPCVFPVLTLKIAALAELASEEEQTVLAHAGAYTGGIVTAMWALAGVVVGLRAAGTQVGWGFQFQSPWFLLGLLAMLVIFAMNLFGAFEMALPVASAAPDVTRHTGLRRSFGEGWLSVLLATPCSAPFMGTAVGFALASGPATIFAVLTMLGLGLAAPFVVLALVPAWREMLPRPGPWLITLKQFLGFTLLATAVWLVWLLGQTTGPDGMASALAWSVALAIGVWLYGAAQFGEGARKWAALSFALLLVGGASAWALPLEPVRRSHDAGPVAEGGITWLEFSAERVDAELQKGRPVFVDFTADWCITCKVNERTVLTTDTVRSAIAEHDVAMVKADWTQRDDRIRSILASYGKAGVPMYLMYAPGQGRARVLPEVLTPSLVAGEMARAVAETDGFR